MDQVAKSKPDGYTIGLGQTSNLAISPTLYAGLPYNPVKDFVPIGAVADAPLVVVVASNSPYKTLADVVTAAKAKPNTLTLATSGNGTVAHLTGELFQKAAGIKLQHVPYNGASQAIVDLLGRSINVFISSVPTTLSQIKVGSMRVLAVTSSERAAVLPNVPTINESGYKGFDARTWFGMVAPAGTPPAIVAELNAEINKVLAMPEIRKKITVEGGNVMGGTPEQFSALIKTEIPRWGKVVKDSGARID